MRKFGLLGYPLEHSVSPFIHKRLFALAGLTDCEYGLYEVKPDELAVKAGEIKELQGFNVTIPYKVEIIPYLDGLDESASRYGAVNCVKTEGGSVGYNTDVYGFLKSVEMLGASLESKILLLGCGGVGRMMAIEAALAGAELTIAIRHESSEEKAAGRISSEINEHISAAGGKAVKITYADRLNLSNQYDLLLNATPAGMYPNVDEMPVVSDILGRVKYVFDAVYNPSPTKLAAEAQKRGAKALDGVAMLVYQAAMAENIWNYASVGEEDLAVIIEEAKGQL
ncbi:MAG: shikimate dehydrogenase [Oscillospiraceae bacterium]|jgi:shikimate dehydrogenase|nr:shikimate dehydrogenase [Oscillospiraceae bacterium]